MGKNWSTQFVDAPQGERGAFQCRVGVQFLLSGVHNEPGIFFAFCTNRLRREISTPKASHDSFAVMNKGKRLTSTRRPSSQYVESKNLTIFNIIRWDDKSTEKLSHCTEVGFTSLLAGRFTTLAVISPPERKLTKCISLHCLMVQCLS